MKNKPTALYRHFSKDNELLYVGIALNAVVRLCQHNTLSSWAQYIARVDIEQFATRQEALDAEFTAIKTELPRYNKANRSRDGEVMVLAESCVVGTRYGFPIYSANPSAGGKKIIDDEAKLSDLSKSAVSLFELIFDEITGLRGKDRDKVSISFLPAKRWNDKLSKRTYERGMSDLLEKGVIFRTLSSDTYYVNVRFIFNGNRVAVINSYRREGYNDRKEINQDD